MDFTQLLNFFQCKLFYEGLNSIFLLIEFNTINNLYSYKILIQQASKKFSQISIKIQE